MADQHFGHFQLKKKLGQGILSTAYEAANLKTVESVALKILRPEFATQKDIADRYSTSAQVCSAFPHNGLVRIRSTGTVGHYVFIEEDMIEGTTLDATIKEKGPLPVKRALGMALQVATALDSFHTGSGGRAHGAVIPAKIMLIRRMGQQPKAVMLDGCSFCAIPIQEQIVESAGGVDRTLIYCAPERIAGAPASTTSDIFQFGAMLYEAVTGRPAFEPAGFQETAHQIMKEPPPPLDESVPDAPRGLAQFVDRCMAKDPDKRIKSAAVAVTFLKSTLAGMSGKTVKKKAVKKSAAPQQQPAKEKPPVKKTIVPPVQAPPEQDRPAIAGRQKQPAQLQENEQPPTAPPPETAPGEARAESGRPPGSGALHASVRRVDFSGFKPSLVLVRNSGDKELNCEVYTNAPWVRADPVEFSIEPGGHRELVLQAGGYPPPDSITAELEIKSGDDHDRVELVADRQQIMSRIGRLRANAVSVALLLVGAISAWSLFTGREPLLERGYTSYSEWTPLMMLALSAVFAAGGMMRRDSGVSLTGAGALCFCMWHIFATAGFDPLAVGLLAAFTLPGPFILYFASGFLFSKRPSMWYMAYVLPVIICLLFAVAAGAVDTAMSASGSPLVWNLF